MTVGTSGARHGQGTDGLFTVHDLTGEAEIRLDSIGCVLRLDEMFEGVEPPT